MEEDNKLSDDEGTSCEPHSSQKGGKKLKLNDGSSQNSQEIPPRSQPPAFTFAGMVPSTSRDENADSGISADKSESTSSEDRSATTSSGPSNEVVNIAASGSNVRTLLLNVRHPIRNRNYRKRRTPGDDDDTDSNDSSRDSDDFSASGDTTPPSVPPDDDMMMSANANLQRLMQLYTVDGGEHNYHSSNAPSSSGFRSNVSRSSSSAPSGSNDYDSYDNYYDGPSNMHSGDTDTDEDSNQWSNRELTPDTRPEDRNKKPDVLLKEQPKHNYLMLKEIINREMGLTFPYGKTTKEDLMFSQRFYGSLHSVCRLKKLHSLKQHKGCVNSINFHPEGQLLVSGSDDTNIIVWDWAKNTAQQTIKTGHKSNVFQSKFLYLNAKSQLNIVTCARDGQVRLIQCPPSGGAGTRRRLYAHARAAHKLHVSAAEPHAVLSAGEDGLLMHADVRTDLANRLCHVKDKSLHTVPLYSVHGHPLDTNEVIVAGRDKFIRMFDRRKCAKPHTRFCPTFFEKNKIAKAKVELALTHLTCAVFNHNGTQILGSYNDDDIYLFDVVKDAYDPELELDPSVDGYTKRYSGHKNSATFKGVSFFGPKSEFVVSGSDCAHIYIWSTTHESIVQWMRGDVSGVVNCIETHPKSPVMATSGLDKDVKIWIPKGMSDPTFKGLEDVVKDNSKNQIRSPLFSDFLPTLFSAFRDENRTGNENTLPEFAQDVDFEGNVCATF